MDIFPRAEKGQEPRLTFKLFLVVVIQGHGVSADAQSRPPLLDVARRVPVSQELQSGPPGLPLEPRQGVEFAGVVEVAEPQAGVEPFHGNLDFAGEPEVGYVDLAYREDVDVELDFDWLRGVEARRRVVAVVGEIKGEELAAHLV